MLRHDDKKAGFMEEASLLFPSNRLVVVAFYEQQRIFSVGENTNGELDATILVRGEGTPNQPQSAL